MQNRTHQVMGSFLRQFRTVTTVYVRVAFLIWAVQFIPMIVLVLLKAFFIRSFEEMGGLFTWEVLVVVIIPALCGAIPLTAIVLTWSQTSGPVKILGCCCAWLFSLASPILGQPFDLSLDGVGLSILVGLMLGHGWGVPLATAVIVGVKEFSPSGRRTPGVRRIPSSMDNAFEDAL